MTDAARGLIPAGVVAVCVLIGVMVGQALERDVQAYARINMTWTVQFGELDPERERTVEAAGAATSAAMRQQFPNVELRYEIPPSKSFFDVRAVGDDRVVVADAANAAAAHLINQDRALESQRRAANLGRIEPTLGQLATEPYLEVISPAQPPAAPAIPALARSILGGLIFGLGLVAAVTIATPASRR